MAGKDASPAVLKPPYNPKLCNAPFLQYLDRLAGTDFEECLWVLELGSAMETFMRNYEKKMEWVLQSALSSTYIIPLMKKVAQLAGKNRDLERYLDTSINKISEELSGDQKLQMELENPRQRVKL